LNQRDVSIEGFAHPAIMTFDIEGMNKKKPRFATGLFTAKDQKNQSI